MKSAEVFRFSSGAEFRVGRHASPKAGRIYEVGVAVIAVVVASGGQSSIRPAAGISPICVPSTLEGPSVRPQACSTQSVLLDPGWAQIEKALATAEPAEGDMVRIDEDLLGRKALEKFLRFRDAIFLRMPHPTSWAITEAGGLTVEQREGSTSHLLRIGRGGKGFLTSFRGQEKLAQTLEI